MHPLPEVIMGFSPGTPSYPPKASSYVYISHAPPTILHDRPRLNDAFTDLLYSPICVL